MAEIDPLPAKPSRPPRIAAIGVAGWDRMIVVDRFPTPGQQANVLAERDGPGGTTANAAAAIARLGGTVTLRALVGNDTPGRQTREALEEAGVDVAGLAAVTGQSTNTAIVIVSARPPDRTFLWTQGASLSRGDRLDISALFGHDTVYIDVYDMPLRRFLLDLPAHTIPSTRLVGSLTSITRAQPADAFDLVMRHDAVIGDEHELIAITEASNLAGAIDRVRSRMRGENLRAAVISRGSSGSLAFSVDCEWQAPAYRVNVIDSTGAGDAFAGAVAFGFSLRWDWGVTLQFANAVAACSIRALGAQTALPSWEEAIEMLRAHETI